MAAAVGVSLFLFTVISFVAIARALRPGGKTGVPIQVTAAANLPVHVWLKHARSEHLRHPLVDLGEAPLDRAPAHVHDTLIFSNDVQGARYEYPIEFGQPDELIRVTKEFQTGHVRFRITHRIASGLYVFLNDRQVAPYSPEVKIELVEGQHTLEIRGDRLPHPVKVAVVVKPNETVEVDPPAAVR